MLGPARNTRQVQVCHSRRAFTGAHFGCKDGLLKPSLGLEHYSAGLAE
jgi:hypothetical protein